MKRLIAIGFIWLGCALAWLVLGSTLVARSGELSGSLLTEVHALWGPPMMQIPPSASYTETVKRTERKITNTDGKSVVTTTEHDEVATFPIALEGSDLKADLKLEHRRKGLLWFPTYSIDFSGRYVFQNTTDRARLVTFLFPLERSNTVFDGFEVLDAKGQPVGSRIDSDGARWTANVPEGARVEYRVAYRSRGTERWEYALTRGTGQVRVFRLDVQVNDAKIDFPVGSLSPTQHTQIGPSWRGTWDFKTLVSNAKVGVELPGKLNPGPLATRITFFAPVGLLFFFFVVSMFAMVRRVELHPMHYFLLGCAFFAYHLLFAYLVDHVRIGTAFAIASATSVALLVSYARLFVGWRFALREMGLAQMVYLVLFSFTFLLEGFTGLAITAGAVLTLSLVMQVTGRMRWGPSTNGLGQS